MVADRRASTNRANARLSTGPRSWEGKQASAKNAIKHGLSRAIKGAQAADSLDCECAFVEVEQHARRAFDRLALALNENHQDIAALDWDERMCRINAAISILEKLERYRAPRFRAWVKCLEKTQVQPPTLDGVHRVADASSD